jgi:hypothetical protein
VLKRRREIGQLTTLLNTPNFEHANTDSTTKDVGSYTELNFFYFLVISLAGGGFVVMFLTRSVFVLAFLNDVINTSQAGPEARAVTEPLFIRVRGPERNPTISLANFTHHIT